jgi:hypothetical protein
MSSVAPEGKFILPFNNTTNPFEKANAFKVFDGISTKKVNANRKVTPKNFGVTQKSV